MNLPTRKHPRLKNYDYGQCGCYHITICVKDRRPILARVIPPSNPVERAMVQLTKYGEITDHYIHGIPAAYQDVQVLKYVIMPNHIHLLLSLGVAASATIPKVIHAMKRMITREIGESIWQESYYDVVIRNKAMFQCEWNYIDGNPDKWTEDAMFVSDI